MRELQIGTWLVAVASLVAFGCDGGGGNGVDGGGMREDGSVGVDSGPRPDSGMVGADGGRDSGGGGVRMCRPPGSECDLLRQDCPAGGACRYLIMMMGEEPRGLCEPAGTATAGMPCTRDGSGDTCAEGTICDPESNRCRQYCCDGNNADCPIGQFCLGGPGSVSFCREGDACNAVDGSGCPEGQFCYLAGEELACFTSRGVAEGASCMFLNDCVAGHACVGDPGAGACRKLCTLGSTADCPNPDTYQCQPLSDVMGIGVCIPSGG